MVEISKASEKDIEKVVEYAKRDLSTLLEPFYSTKEDDYSIGMGLSLCYDIVKSYGGSINVASKIGKGTTFTIKFPKGEII